MVVPLAPPVGSAAVVKSNSLSLLLQNRSRFQQKKRHVLFIAGLEHHSALNETFSAEKVQLGWNCLGKSGERLGQWLVVSGQWAVWSVWAAVGVCGSPRYWAL